MQKKIRVLVFSAFLVALEIVLNRFCSFNTLGHKIGVSFIPCVIAAILYGPWVSAAVNACGDFLGAILFPIGPYHPGFTVCAALMGLLNGFFLNTDPINTETHNSLLHFRMALHWEKIRFFPNVVIPVLINTLVLGLFVNTAWVSMLYGSKTYWGWFSYRLVEYAILVPVKLVITPMLLQLAKPLRKIVRNSETAASAASKK